MPRRRGLCPRFLAAVVRSKATLAFTAERQVVMPTMGSMPVRKNRLLNAVFAVVMSCGGVGIVLAIIGQFRSGTAFQRYKNWQGLWVSYGELLVFVGVAWGAVLVGGLWAWIARRREESSLIKKYKKDNGAP
jgi:hypothetical protein